MPMGIFSCRHEIFFDLESEDGDSQLEVKSQEENVWFSHCQMAILFERDNIRHHIINISIKKIVKHHVEMYEIFCSEEYKYFVLVNKIITFTRYWK